MNFETIRRVIDTETIQDADLEDVTDRAGVDEADVRAVFDALAAFECDRRPWRDPEVLYELYYIDGLTQAEVAERLDCGEMTINRWMKRHDMAPGLGYGHLTVPVPPQRPGRSLP